jgi:hypothetical protein
VGSENFDDHSISPSVISSEVEIVLLRVIVVGDRKTNHYMCVGASGLRACVSDTSCLRDAYAITSRCFYAGLVIRQDLPVW